MRSLFLPLFLLIALLFSAPGHASPLDDLQGKWNTGLMTDEEGYFQYRQIYEFTGTNCTMKVDVLVTHPMGQSGERMLWECDFTVVGPSRDVEGAWEVDVNMRHFWRTPLHPSTVEDFNDKKMCGFDDWALGVRKDVGNLVCDGDMNKTGMMYELVKITPETSIQFGLQETDGDPVGAPRPTELDPTNVVPRNGAGGPIDPNPRQDVIKGFYQITGFKSNPSDCDEGGLRAGAAPYSHFQLIANTDIFPMMVGWSFQTCSSRADCEAKPDEIILGADFGIHEFVDDTRYRGLSRQSSWTGKCSVRATQTSTERAADGSLRMVSKFLSGDVQGIDTSDDCTLENPLIDAQLPLFQCDKMLELSSRRL